VWNLFSSRVSLLRGWVISCMQPLVAGLPTRASPSPTASHVDRALLDKMLLYRVHHFVSRCFNMRSPELGKGFTFLNCTSTIRLQRGLGRVIPLLVIRSGSPSAHCKHLSTTSKQQMPAAMYGTPPSFRLGIFGEVLAPQLGRNGVDGCQGPLLQERKQPGKEASTK